MIATGQTRRLAAFLCPVVLVALLLNPSARARSSAPSNCDPPPAASLVVNVIDKGARGDGNTDDTAAIQAAIDEVGGTKGTVLVPDGTYMVDAASERSLKLKSDMTLRLSDGATLKAIPNAAKKYAVITISNASQVWVIGGTLEGDRDQHQGKSGEWGMGIHIGKRAEHITISGVTSKKMWGDGFYVSGADDVRFCMSVLSLEPIGTISSSPRRPQGLSARGAFSSSFFSRSISDPASSNFAWSSMR